MTNCGNNACYNACTSTGNSGGGISNFAFILVLFILLVICGAAFMF